MPYSGPRFDRTRRTRSDDGIQGVTKDATLAVGGVGGYAGLDAMLENAGMPPWTKIVAFIVCSLIPLVPRVPAAIRAVRKAWYGPRMPYSGLMIAFLGLLLSGCATTGQSLTTADGDHYQHSGRSLFSKQDIQADSNLVVYPNASGLEFQVGTAAAQDSTEALKALIALGQILAPIMQAGSARDTTPLAPPAPSIRDTIRDAVNEALRDAIRNRLNPVEVEP